MLDQKLKDLIEFAKTTDIQELTWEKNGARVSFRRSDVRPIPLKTSEPAAAPAPAEAEPEPLYIRSTMVGTFFRADSSNRPPLVVEGTIVNSGQPVASVEAMKIRKDVVAQMDCRIVRPLVTDGHAVEYGQPLFEVEPSDELN